MFLMLNCYCRYVIFNFVLVVFVAFVVMAIFTVVVVVYAKFAATIILHIKFYFSEKRRVSEKNSGKL